MSTQAQKPQFSLALFSSASNPSADSFEKRLIEVMNARERENGGDDIWSGRAMAFMEDMLKAVRLAFLLIKPHSSNLVISVDTRFVLSQMTLRGLLINAQTLAVRVKNDEGKVSEKDQIKECKDVLKRLCAQLQVFLPGFGDNDTPDQIIRTVIAYRESFAPFEDKDTYSYEAVGKALNEAKKSNDVEKVALYSAFLPAIKHIGFFQMQCVQPVKEVERAYYREKRGLSAIDPLPDDIQIALTFF